MLEKQTDISKFSFHTYFHKRRWMSIWHQMNEVLSLNPSTVLEVGIGSGLFKTLMLSYGINIESVDIDPEVNPDYVASATDLPFENDSYNCVCSFQVLEHLPYTKSIQAFGEIVRVAKDDIIISLPDAKELYTYSLQIPKIGTKVFHIAKPRLHPLEHKFDGQHYWEINKKGYPLQKIIDDFTKNDVELVKTYNVKENTYHRFFLFKKTS